MISPVTALMPQSNVASGGLIVTWDVKTQQSSLPVDRWLAPFLPFSLAHVPHSRAQSRSPPRHPVPPSAEQCPPNSSLSRPDPWRAIAGLPDPIFKARAFFSKRAPWSRLLPFRSLLGRFN
jgi:hypothetical protein